MRDHSINTFSPAELIRHTLETFIEAHKRDVESRLHGYCQIAKNELDSLIQDTYSLNNILTEHDYDFGERNI